MNRSMSIDPIANLDSQSKIAAHQASRVTHCISYREVIPSHILSEGVGHFLYAKILP